MALFPQTSDDLLTFLEHNGWNTEAFRRHLDAADWPVELRQHCQSASPTPPPPAPDLAPPLSQVAGHPRQPQELPQSRQAPAAGGDGSGGAAVAAAPQQRLRISDVVAREAVIAYGKIRQYARYTPLEPSPWLSGLAGAGPGGCCTALLKLESEQHSGSFKVRGALNKLLSLPAHTLSRGVFTASTGNHALAVLHACAALSRATPAPAAPAHVAAPSSAASCSAPVAALAAAGRPHRAPTPVPAAPHTGCRAAAGQASGEASVRGGEGSSAAASVTDGGGGDLPPRAGAGAGPAGAGPAGPSDDDDDDDEGGSAYGAGGGGPLRLRPHVYVPETASPYKVRKLSSLGAELHLNGTDCLQAELAARAAAAAAGAVYVSPYNDPWVMAGQGTVALELLAARRRGQLDAVLVPVGGGGLIGGVASVLKAADPAIRVIGCQPAASDVMARSVAAGAIVPEAEAEDADGGGAGGGGGTLSDATAGGVEPGSATLQPCTDCVDEWVTVGEEEIAEALVGLLEEHSKLVEGAAACALAAFKRLAPRLAGLSVVAVCCGGNIALHTLRSAIDLVRPPQPPPQATAPAPAVAAWTV